MPQTTNYGFPLLADTPPEGMTGKDLRDLILGESETSLAQMLDAALKALADEKEDASNKVLSGQSWLNTEGDKLYPSMNRMSEFVKWYDSSARNDLTQYAMDLSGYKTTERITWDGVTNDAEPILGAYYKVSDYTRFPDRCTYILSSSKTGYVMTAITKNRLDTLREDYGFVRYGEWEDGEAFNNFGVIIFDRSGTLPADVIKTVAASYTGGDVSYEAGVYLPLININGERIYMSEFAGLDMPIIPTKVGQLTNDSGYVTQDEVARQLAALLPEFSAAADEGKVLGIQNGKLAWVMVQAATGGVDASVDGSVLALGDGATVDGNTLVLDGDASVDGSTLILGG